MPFARGIHMPHDRRTFLVAGGLGFFGLNLADAAAYAAGDRPPRGRRRAKSTILIWLSGGASHIDTWDMKPDAPAEYRGPFRPVATSAPGIALCEHLPHLARQAHHLADRPLARRPRPRHRRPPRRLLLQPHRPRPGPHLPPAAQRPHAVPDRLAVDGVGRRAQAAAAPVPAVGHHAAAQGRARPSTPGPGQFAARLGIEYDPVFVDGTRERPLDFTVPGPEPARRRLRPSGCVDRRGLLRALDDARRLAEHDLAAARLRQAPAARRSRCWRRGRRRRRSTCAREPEAVRANVRPGHQRHVDAAGPAAGRGRACRSSPSSGRATRSSTRLCKSGGGWDTHGNNFNCLKDRLLPEFDRPFAALLDDLHQRGLLDDDARPGHQRDGPQAEDRRPALRRRERRRPRPLDGVHVGAARRRRHPRRPGLRHQRQAAPSTPPTTRSRPEHIARTVFHAMGIDDLHGHRPRGPAVPPDGRRPAAHRAVLRRVAGDDFRGTVMHDDTQSGGRCSRHGQPAGVPPRRRARRLGRWAWPTSSACRPRRRGRAVVAQVDHRPVAVGRAEPHGDVRPQARRPERVPRRVPADPDQRPRHRRSASTCPGWPGWPTSSP